MSFIKGEFYPQPLFAAVADLPVKVVVKPQRPISPDYIDFIIAYKSGNTLARTNKNVGSYYARYNDNSNVQYLANAKNVQFSLDVDSGYFQALTTVNINGKNIVQLMNYQLMPLGKL